MRGLASATLSHAVHLPQLSLHSPLGDITVSEEAGRLVSVDWGWGCEQVDTALLREARAQLFAYFDGTLMAFDLPLAAAGTAYQRRVWEALTRIPYGSTRTYGQVAAGAGGAPRSVGQASGNNPIPIIIPCHRVVAARGLGEYSGGSGLGTKRWLLDLERRAQAAAMWRTG